MKKFVFVGMFVLAAVGFAFAADPIVATSAAPAAAATPTASNSDVVINAYLAGYLTLSNLTSRHDFMLNTNGSTEAVATATIATNLKNWDLTILSSHADANGSALVNDESNRIPYTFTLVGGTNIATIWSTENIPTAGLKNEFTNRVSGGTGGEMVTLSITYDGENVSSWFANKIYTDTINVAIAAR